MPPISQDVSDSVAYVRDKSAEHCTEVRSYLHKALSRASSAYETRVKAARHHPVRDQSV